MSTDARLARLVRDPWPVFLIALVLAITGFWPSFFGTLAKTPLPHHIHGWSATAWMLLPLSQFILIRQKQRAWHRRIGYASLGLATVVAVSGVYVVHMMAFRNLSRFALVSVKFVWLDLTGIALFAILVVVAIVAAARKDIRLHLAALMASALIPLEAAIERLYVNHLPAFVPDFDAALYAALTSLEIICAILIAAEWRSGRVRWPMPSLLCYYVVMHVTATPVAQNEQFRRFSDLVGTIGRPIR